MRRYASSATNAALARLNRSAAPTTKCATFRILEKDPFGGSSPALWWQRWAEEFVAQGKDSPVRLDAALLASDAMKMTFARAFWNNHSTKRVVEFDQSVPLHRNAFEAMLQNSGSEWGQEVVIPASKENEVAHAYAKVIISSYMSKAVELIVESPPFEPVTQRQMAASIVDLFGVIHAEQVESIQLSDALGDGQDMNLQCRFLEGKYGLWGHGLQDLVMHSLNYSPELDAFLPQVDS